MAPVLALARRPPAQTPERAELAQAIAARAEFGVSLAATRKAVQTAQEAVETTRTIVRDAKAALTTAKEETATHLVAVARGSDAVAPSPLRAARAALTDAEDALEAAEAVHATLAKPMEEMEQQDRASDLYGPAARVRKAALAVIAAELPGATLIAEVEAAQRELLEKTGALRWMITNGVLPRKEENGYHLLTPAGSKDTHFETPPSYWHDLLPGMRAPAIWDAALAALMVDADAKLPDLARPAGAV